MPVAGSGAAVEAKNGIRASIKGLFPDRDCATLVRPMHDEEVCVNGRAVGFWFCVWTGGGCGRLIGYGLLMVQHVATPCHRPPKRSLTRPLFVSNVVFVCASPAAGAGVPGPHSIGAAAARVQAGRGVTAASHICKGAVSGQGWVGGWACVCADNRVMCRAPTRRLWPRFASCVAVV